MIGQTVRQLLDMLTLYEISCLLTLQMGVNGEVEGEKNDFKPPSISIYLNTLIYKCCKSTYSQFYNLHFYALGL